MAEVVVCPEQFVFGLDIGTRSIVGTIGYMDNKGFHVVAMEVKEHDTRAMIDGQVHDIAVVGEEIKFVKEQLEKRIGRKLSSVCIAAAGRVLRTINVNVSMDVDEELRITAEDIYNLDLKGIDTAHRKANEQEQNVNFYCVGYTPVKYFMNDYEMKNLEGHKASRIGVELLATFLPEDVVDGLYSAVEAAGLEVANLTLEPIAAMNVAIPEQYRLLNIALVDVGAGTSDICITKDGSIIGYGMIPSAGDEISEIIAKNYLVDFKQAEKIKLAACGKKNISFKDVMGMKMTISPEEIINLTSPIADSITKDIADKIYELNGEKTVKAVFVVGGGGKIPGFTQSLAKHLDLPEARVALRGKEVLTDVEFLMTNVKKDPLYVTPIGICINYYNQKNNFIHVTVNGERVKLYDNNNLTIIDALMQIGYPNEQLFPRRGPAVNYTLNGAARMIRGVAGEPAVVRKNGKDTNINATIEKNDYIDITPSTIGQPQTMKLQELAEYKEDFKIEVNGMSINCPKFAYVNGELQPGAYTINEGDSIVMENYYTVRQLFEFLDFSLEGVTVEVNNSTAGFDDKVYENFKVNYRILETTKPVIPEPEPVEVVSEEINPIPVYDSYDSIPEPEEEYVRPTPKAVNQAKPASQAPVEEPAPAPKLQNSRIVVLINGKSVILSGKPNYTFVDIFDFYSFDLSKPQGTELVTTINGVKAEFMGPIYDGSIIELYWK